MTRHLYEISALASQTSFDGENSAVVASRNVGCFLRLGKTIDRQSAFSFLSFSLMQSLIKMMEKTKTDTREGLIARGVRVPSDHKPFQHDDK